MQQYLEMCKVFVSGDTNTSLQAYGQQNQNLEQLIINFVEDPRNLGELVLLVSTHEPSLLAAQFTTLEVLAKSYSASAFSGLQHARRIWD